VALAGFLLRGGIVLLALPSVILPSVIGIASLTGVDAISIAGQPTLWLVEVIVLAIVLASAWLVAASVIGSLLDTWLIEMATTDGGPAESRPATGTGSASESTSVVESDTEEAGRRLTVPPMQFMLQLAAIRLICLVPVAVAVGWAATRIFNATYDELTNPTNLTTPLPFRVVLAAGDAVAVVVVVWLASETVAAIAVRRRVLAGSGVLRSIAGALGQIARRPLSTLLMCVVTYAVSAVAIGLALIATSTAFDWCRIAARNQDPIAIKLGFGAYTTVRDFRPVIFALAALVLTLAWALALAISAVSSAWRSSAFTNEVVDDLPAIALESAEARPTRLGLSGANPETSGD
jgi:hypothetical protein